MKPRFVPFVSLALSILATLSSASAQDAFAETKSVLQTALKGELMAHMRYLAYAKKAEEERYPRISFFFYSLGQSEGIHARNFKAILDALGAASDFPVPGFPFADTKGNIKVASDAELEEIDTRYPAFIKRLTTEGMQEAIKSITFAWKAEKQHRDLVTQIQSGTGMMFGLLVKTFEDNPVDYFVCQACGSTLIELPKDKCPICTGPVSGYLKISQAVSKTTTP